MKTRPLWISGLLAGLVMIVPFVVFLNFHPSESTPQGKGDLLAVELWYLLLYPLWIAASPVFGVWIYR
jgi:hypothetical protein